MLSPESCPEPGKYHNNRTPFAVGIMDAFSDPDVERVIVMSSAQVAKTTIIENVVGYFMHFDPCPIMVIQPTDELVKAFSEERFTPMVRDTKVLRPLIKDAKAKGAGNRISSKAFPGGHLVIVSAKSEPSVQGRPRRVVLWDEVDRYESTFAVGHGEMRAVRFWNRRYGLFSTPGEKDSSIIFPEYEAGTREQWHLPCPVCGMLQPLNFGDQFDRSNATYTCGSCGAQSDEFAWKAGQGQWVARRSLAEAHRTRSFHLNALVAPGLHWTEIIEQEQKALKARDEGDLKTWINFVTQIMGEPYEEKGDTIEHEEDFEHHRHRYDCDVPAGVLLLTATGDTQDNRVEIEVCGWGAGYECWGIQYLVIHGTMDQPETKAQIDALLNKTWLREDGARLAIARYLQDSGGHYVDHVYDFTRPRSGRGVYAIKGGTVPTDPLVGREGLVDRKGKKTPLFTLGVNVGKSMVFDRLRVTHEGPGYCHWPIEQFLSDGETPRGYDREYFYQLTSEKKVRRIREGRLVMVWVKKQEGRRNESWDLRVYNLAAVLIAGGDALLRTLDKGGREGSIRKASGGGGGGGWKVLSRGVGR